MTLKLLSGSAVLSSQQLVIAVRGNSKFENDLKGLCHRDFAVFRSILCINHHLVSLLVHKMLLQDYKGDIKVVKFNRESKP